MLDRVASRTPPTITLSPMISLPPPVSRLLLRGDAQAMALAGEVLSLTLASQACRAATGAGRAALWLGPDEQLLLLPDSEGPGLLAALAEALVDTRHSLVDISHRQIAIEVSGARAEALLNTACPLDLDAAAFPVGMCTRTLLGKAEIVLWRTGPQTFRLEVWRSFGAYVTGLLAEAAREFGPAALLNSDGIQA